MDPFASHVVRALLLVLASDVLPAEDETNGAPSKSAFAVRSKKSATYKVRQGSMKSVFTESGDHNQTKPAKRTPKEFRKAAVNIISTLREQLAGNEVRVLAANQVASPVLQVRASSRLATRVYARVSSDHYQLRYY